MNAKPIRVFYDINRMEPVDLISTIHIDDKNTRYLELTLLDHGSLLVLQGCTVKARFVATDKALLSDNVPCTVTADNTILVPIDAAVVQSMACDLRIEINIVSGTNVLTLPFPLWVRVRGSILGNAHVSPDSEGTIPELLKEVEEELKRVQGFITDDDVYEIMDGYSPTISTTNLDAQTLVTITDMNGAHNFFVKDGSSVTNAAVDANGDLIMSIQQKPTSSVHPTIHTLEVNAGHVVGAAGAKGDKGDKGDPGDDYVLTAQDKTDIANIVLQLLPTTQGVQYGN